MAQRPRPQPLSPTRFFLEGLDPAGRTRQASFAALLLVLLGLWALRLLGPGQVEGWHRGHEALATIPLAVFLVPAVGHVLRRLNDLGWSGWWAWALALPWARWALLGALLLMPTSQRRRRGDSPLRFLGLALAGAVAVGLAGSLLWTTAVVAGQGMKPSLLPGDLVLVRRAPVAAERGEVMAFRLPGESGPRVGRVVALAGERVAVEGGVPVVAGVPADRAEAGLHEEVFGPEGPAREMPVCGNGAVGLGAVCRTRLLVETLPGGAAYPVLDAGARPLDAMEEVAVPEGSLFVLGDHRDAAEDSRLPRAVGGAGLVAEGEVMGRVDLVIASSAAAHPWDPRGWRLSRLLEGVP